MTAGNRKLLSRDVLHEIDPKLVGVPDDQYFSLPEKVLQFGTGVLLRGLPDDLIHRANVQGAFGGRIVVVKSTGAGDTGAFDRQDCLYTQCFRGIVNGHATQSYVVNAAISRVLSATNEWNSILEFAGSPGLQLVLSNTTEAGIVYHPEKIEPGKAPQSFPGKLLAVLMERHRKFGAGDRDFLLSRGGLVIVPTELITDNGAVLKEIISRLAQFNGLEKDFVEWLQENIHFCDSLVDRIVPGRLPEKEDREVSDMLGYSDDLRIMSEPYALWAVRECHPDVKKVLSFGGLVPGFVLAPDITPLRELKLRLLNGSHSLSCALAIGAGFTQVKEALSDPVFRRFLSAMMKEEIIPCITGDGVTRDEAVQFSLGVMDRFSNPFLEHRWLSIAVQYSSKMNSRVVPLLMKFTDRFGFPPPCMTAGFAAFLLFTAEQQGQLAVEDVKAIKIRELWKDGAKAGHPGSLLSSRELWDEDLSSIPGFAEALAVSLEQLQDRGAVWVMEATVSESKKHES